ncbi:hypothetical protein MKX01_038439 [Papaver californicum]|nr:hypothetical protein MKX01_038439 [Papaver californicum]
MKEQFHLKVTYKQLKSIIASACSREMRGLARENHPNKKIPVDPEVLGGGNSSVKLFSERRGSSEKEEQQHHRTNCFGGDINVGAANHDAKMNYLEIQSPDENSRHLLSENGNTLFPEDCRGKGLISTRERSPEVNKIQGLGGSKLGFDIVGNAADKSLKQGLKDGGVRLKHLTSAPLVPENTNEILQDNPPDSTLVCNEKESSCLPELMQEDSLDKGNYCGDIGQLKSSRLNSTPLHANGSVQDPSVRVLVSREKEVNELAERTLVHDFLGGVNFVEDGYGCECIPSKKLKKSREDSEIQHIEEVIAEEALDAYHIKSSIDVSKVVGASAYTALSGINGEKRACSFDSVMAIAAKKQKFLKCDNPFSLGAQVIGGWTEGNVCKKCNRSDGNLLICSVVSYVVVHERCAGSSVGVTDSGKYRCPICSCVEAIAVYRETKLKASLVEEKLLFHKNQLSKLCPC